MQCTFAPGSFSVWNVLAFSVVVLGGLGSIPGALLGGLVFGLVYEFGGTYMLAQRDVLIFAILIFVLVVRPTGPRMASPVSNPMVDDAAPLAAARLIRLATPIGDLAGPRDRTLLLATTGPGRSERVGLASWVSRSFVRS